jgi:glycosyltransferase involved in cell wall biosynthesis
MKVGLVSSCVPLVRGGYRNIVDWLDVRLRESGHRCEVIYLPSTDTPDTILRQMGAFRLFDLADGFDRIITFRPPAHVVAHPMKIVWFIHHIRMYYDLWNTTYCPVPDTAAWRALRDEVRRADTRALREATRVFSNSKVVSQRLRTFNGIDSEVLYPPILRPETFVGGEYGDEIVYVSRLEHHKRQHLLIEAMRHTRSGVRLRLSGATTSEPYVHSLRESIERYGLGDKVTLEDRWISDGEKAQRLSSALAVAYAAYDEDSYGYPTIEAAHAKRATVTLADAGGVLEFVADGRNGRIVAADPASIAEVFDELYLDRALARELGEGAHARLAELGISWDTVIAKLLA